ncbi:MULTISPECIES: DUF805 domain-containing protein [Acidiphilium]|uniref:DUF805 domain-containing protein n=1 Tax=Acidiphilium cryptum (strain JF-5) TaxID=349163 RepID=A5FTX7_ACICJ|nr:MULTISPECIES: DUF805 domain-containing protein [Acidiphilium]ABQ29059.1 protein of unknown function DUF805 [Acidiphilium cryptum JF-5]KDM68352.1 hypothetical protein ACIDI_7c00330 [Acidiphilium sp. JA12-A1]
MTFTESVKRGSVGWSRYSGRASRSEFWWFFLFATLVRGAFAFIRLVLMPPPIGQGVPMLVLVTLVSLILLVPTIPLEVRRLHDVGRSGWLIVVFYVLFAALIMVSEEWMRLLSRHQETHWQGEILLVLTVFTGVTWVRVISLLASRGGPRPNRYGPASE